MALGALGCSSVLRCHSRSGRPRPVSYLGIVAFLSCWGCLRPFFSQSPDGGAGGGTRGGSAGSDDGEDAEAPLVPTKICMATNRDSSTAPAVTDTTANKDAMNRMKGLLGSMCSIVDKLHMFCGTIFLWLLSNSPSLNSSPNSPASKAGQNFKNPWMQVLITGNLILCFISFMLMALASKLKDSESIDGVLCKIFIWLLLPVSLALWPGLFMILHFFAHTPVFVLWPLGALFSILPLSFWYWGFYKEQQKIMKELYEGGVLEKGILPEKPESQAALAKV